MAASDALRDISRAARPLIEQALDIADQIAALRNVATEKGLDWSQLKALLKAQIQDERDETGEGKRVKRVVEKAEFASAYADMLGLANMNENNFSQEQFDAETGEVINPYAAAQGGEKIRPETAVKNAPKALESDEPSPEAGPQAEASLAGTGTGMLADREGRPEGEGTSVALPTPFDPPAFLAREAKPLRPNCLRPDNCAGQGATHCYQCRRAMADEAAA